MALGVSGNEKSLISLVADADIVVQLVILLLVAGSVWSWTIIIQKWMRLSEVTKKTKYFEKAFCYANFDKLFERFKSAASAPIEHVFVASINKRAKYSNDASKGSQCKDEINSAIIVAKARAIDELEGGLSYLATIAAATPFIGLFGTVWGIMHSFQSIASTKNTSLAIVAPGIAEALFATGLGLAAAIPALIFYNILNAKIHQIESSLDIFSVELYTMLTNHQRD